MAYLITCTVVWLSLYCLLKKNLVFVDVKLLVENIEIENNKCVIIM